MEFMRGCLLLQRRKGDEKALHIVRVLVLLKVPPAGQSVGRKVGRKENSGARRDCVGSQFPRRSPLEYDYDVGTYLNSPTIRVEIDRLV